MTRPAVSKSAIVMSGGGARGAYEAGVVRGIIEVLDLRAEDAAPFDVFSGSSVGAINAAFLVSNAHRGDMNTEGLLDLWRSLSFRDHVRPDPLGLLGWKRALTSRSRQHGVPLVPKTLGRSLLDAERLDALVRKSVDWERMHANIESGLVRSLVIAALHVGSGRTTLFAELAPGAEFRIAHDPRRTAKLEPITDDHVLASAAIPLLFPARRVGRAYYCDGGLRFNTPISPAIRMGASRLVVISLLRRQPPPPPDSPEAVHGGEEAYPHPAFLLGKVLNALLLDPVTYDLQVLDRLNRLLEALEQALDPKAYEEVQKILVDARGARYHRLKTLVFRPSQDIGHMAAEHVRTQMPIWRTGRISSWILGRVAAGGTSWESDLAAFLLFDGSFTTKLVELGRADAHRRADDIRSFFAPSGRTNPPPALVAQKTSDEPR